MVHNPEFLDMSPLISILGKYFAMSSSQGVFCVVVRAIMLNILKLFTLSASSAKKISHLQNSTLSSREPSSFESSALARIEGSEPPETATRNMSLCPKEEF